YDHSDDPRGQKGARQPQSQRGQGCKARRQAEDRGHLDRARSRLQPEQVPRTGQSLPSQRRRKGGIHNWNEGTANLSRRRYRRRSRNEGSRTEGRTSRELYPRSSSTTSFPVPTVEAFRSSRTILLGSWETWGSQGRRRWLSANQGSACGQQRLAGCSNTREQALYSSS